jgi:hypothetical protein
MNMSKKILFEMFMPEAGVFSGGTTAGHEAGKGFLYVFKVDRGMAASDFERNQSDRAYVLYKSNPTPDQLKKDQGTGGGRGPGEFIGMRGPDDWHGTSGEEVRKFLADKNPNWTSLPIRSPKDEDEKYADPEDSFTF